MHSFYLHKNLFIMKNKFLTVYLSSLLTISVISGCVKPTDQSRPIMFIAKYESPFVKSSYSTFAEGNAAIIFTYSGGSLSNNISGTPVTAICQTGGNLNTGNPLYLIKGNYDFYSVSNNSPNTINIVFTNGLSGQLNNGTDYLWAGNKGIAVINGGTVSFVYRRLACKINISINANSNVSNLSVNYVLLRLPSASGIKMSLSTGTVNNATSTNAPSIVPGSGNTRSFICLPSIAQTQIDVSLNANIDGETVNNRIYSTTINQSFLSGNSYDINLNLNTDNAFGVFVTVTPWQIDNITITY